MGTSAPPLPEYLYEPVEQEDRFEALIKEARRRTRRRRVFYGVVIAMIAAGLVAYMAPGDAPPAENAAPKAQSEPPAPPAITFDGDASSLVAKWSEYHVGFVLAYGDGRVIWASDVGATAIDEIGGAGLMERRLSPAGRELFASGAVPLEAVLRGDGQVHRRDELWIDPTMRAYVPENYAACYWLETPPDQWVERMDNASVALPRLPQSAQSLLAGKEETYAGTPLAYTAGWPAIECSELTAQEAVTVSQVLAFSGAMVFAGFTPEVIYAPPPSIDTPRDFQTLMYAPSSDQAVSVSFWAIMPHGDLVRWGG
jgi:hypothetical protein